MSTAEHDIPDIIGQMERKGSVNQLTELGRIVDPTQKKRYVQILDSNEIHGDRFHLSDGRKIVEISLDTANRLLHAQDYAKARAILDLEGQSAGEAKTPHSKERQKKLTWDVWESITPDPYRAGGPHIKIYKRSDDQAASLARNSKPPYIQVDIDVAQELIRTNDYKRANKLMEQDTERTNAAKQHAITTATRGSLGRILHCLSGAKVTKTEVLSGGLPVSFVTIPVKRQGTKTYEKFIVAGKTQEKAVAIPVNENAERWGPPKIEREVFEFLRNRAASILISQDRRKEQKMAKKKKGGKPKKTVAKQ